MAQPSMPHDCNDTHWSLSKGSQVGGASNLWRGVAWKPANGDFKHPQDINKQRVTFENKMV